MANPGLKADFGLTLELFQDGETQDDAFLADTGLTLELEPPPAPPAGRIWVLAGVGGGLAGESRGLAA